MWDTWKVGHSSKTTNGGTVQCMYSDLKIETHGCAHMSIAKPTDRGFNPSRGRSTEKRLIWDIWLSTSGSTTEKGLTWDTRPSETYVKTTDVVKSMTSWTLNSWHYVGHMEGGTLVQDHQSSQRRMLSRHSKLQWNESPNWIVEQISISAAP